MFSFVENMVLQAGAWGALGFFLGALLEEVAFPLPSPLLLIGVAFFFGKPITAAVIVKMLASVIVPICIGATIGSLIIYGLAYSGGKVTIDKFSRWLGFSWADVEKLRQKLAAKSSDEWALFLSRCIPFTPTTLITVVAGVIRMNPLTFMLITLTGIFIRVTALFVGAMIFGGAIFGG
ncbi:VTT domain-containing protein [Candidatus Parcubacteria bacterium]|nr:VTT domain-containing protein [Candidatus Parcubacteria bacterium]